LLSYILELENGCDTVIIWSVSDTAIFSFSEAISFFHFFIHSLIILADPVKS